MFEGEGTAVISLDDQACCRIYERLISFETGNREVCPISCEGEVEEGVYAENETLFDTRLDAPEIGSIASIRTLRGQHNHQNIAAAYAACRAAGVEPEVILEHVKTFEGLPHRQYPVRTINGVGYVNDSKATNAEAASKALGAYKNIYWIAGGRPKGTGLEDILPFIQSIKHAFLIGEAMTAFAAWLDQYSIPYTLSGTLDAAVQDAHKAAQESRSQPGGAGTVLLSPACASFDQFPSYAKRGEVFTDLVNNLPEEEEAAA